MGAGYFLLRLSSAGARKFGLASRGTITNSPSRGATVLRVFKGRKSYGVSSRRSFMPGIAVQIRPTNSLNFYSVRVRVS
jgi:hypothetical protein